MARTYRTSQVARLVGVHPNTVRLYEEWGFISKPERRPNGYRVFTDWHVEQFLLARAALRTEILQSNLRRLALEIIKASGASDLDTAESTTKQYAQLVVEEQLRAEEAIAIVQQLLTHQTAELGELYLTRQQTADQLQITIDTLRNWELNSLLSVKRRHNGYRVYSDEDIRRLKIIRTLRLAHYSLAAILRLMTQLDRDPDIDLAQTIDQPDPEDDIVSVCDRLLTSLRQASLNAEDVLGHISRLRELSDQQ